MKFVCTDCGKVFDKEIDNKLSEILLEIEESGRAVFLESRCGCEE